jgi:hypothetical protein
MRNSLNILSTAPSRPDAVSLSFNPLSHTLDVYKQIASIPGDPDHYLRWATGAELDREGPKDLPLSILGLLYQAIDVHDTALEEAGFKLPFPRDEAGRDIRQNRFITHAPSQSDVSDVTHAAGEWAYYRRVRIIDGCLINEDSPPKDLIETLERKVTYVEWAVSDGNPTAMILDDIFKDDQIAKEKGSGEYYVLDTDPYLGRIGVDGGTWDEVLVKLHVTAGQIHRHSYRNEARRFRRRIRDIKALGAIMLGKTDNNEFRSLFQYWEAEWMGKEYSSC